MLLEMLLAWCDELDSHELEASADQHVVVKRYVVYH
jgi:hypothetical protein